MILCLGLGCRVEGVGCAAGCLGKYVGLKPVAVAVLSAGV